jgi:putative endonuclease
VQCWKINGDKSFAMKIEAHIKKLSRIEKEEMIANPNLLLIDPCIEIEHNI